MKKDISKTSSFEYGISLTTWPYFNWDCREELFLQGDPMILDGIQSSNLMAMIRRKAIFPLNQRTHSQNYLKNFPALLNSFFYFLQVCWNAKRGEEQDFTSFKGSCIGQISFRGRCLFFPVLTSTALQVKKESLCFFLSKCGWNYYIQSFHAVK